MFTLLAAAGLAEIPEADQRWLVLSSILTGIVFAAALILIVAGGLVALCRWGANKGPRGAYQPGDRPNTV
jgi:hypothetical protein